MAVLNIFIKLFDYPYKFTPFVLYLLFGYNNFLFRFYPFNACAEFFGNKSNGRIRAVILNKRGGIKLDFSAVYIGDVRTDINQNRYILTCFEIFSFNRHHFFFAVPRNVCAEVFRNKSCRKHCPVINNFRAEYLCRLSPIVKIIRFSELSFSVHAA